VILVSRFLVGAPSLGLTFAILLAVATQPREWHRNQALRANFESAHLAQAVVVQRDSPKRFIDLPYLEPLTLGEHHAHFALMLFGSEVATVHAVVSAQVSTAPKLGGTFEH
jgi:hypothetical protein